MKKDLSMKNYQPLLERGVEEIIGKEELIKQLKLGKKLRIKHGVDPTTQKLTLGHAVCYHKLKEFQEAGHKVIFLIGDFTARFGDPSDKIKSRQLREKDEVEGLAKNYIREAGQIIDIKKAEIRYNSEWYDSMSAQQLLKIVSWFTVDRMLERDMFVERKRKNEEIRMHEPIYPILQAFDSVMLKSDITVCGTDQKFNELQGRKMQKDFGQAPQVVMTVPILPGIDGRAKMSQSLGNDIGILEDPKSQFGKIMSIPDSLIVKYYELAARTSGQELEKIKREAKNPKKRRDLKAALAEDIVALFHGSEASLLAQEDFNRVFRDKKEPMEIPEFKIKRKRCAYLVDLLTELKLAPSKSEARRLVTQNGVKIDNAIIDDPKSEICLYDGMIIKVGKMRFLKIVKE